MTQEQTMKSINAAVTGPPASLKLLVMRVLSVCQQRPMAPPELPGCFRPMRNPQHAQSETQFPQEEQRRLLMCSPRIRALLFLPTGLFASIDGLNAEGDKMEHAAEVVRVQ